MIGYPGPTTMCISLPAKVLSISGRTAEIEIDNLKHRVLLSIDGVDAGDWVLVYGGMAIGKIDEKTALESRELLRQAGVNQAR